jgi:hypothetical protein
MHMLKKTATAVAFVGSMVVAGMASAETRVVYAGGHDPARAIRYENTTKSAPGALTGSQVSTRRMEAIRVGSRIVGYRIVDR